MTAKEKRQYKAMEIRLEECELARKKAQQAWVDIFNELYEAKVALRECYSVMMEQVINLNLLMRHDPAFMEMSGGQFDSPSR